MINSSESTAFGTNYDAALAASNWNDRDLPADEASQELPPQISPEKITLANELNEAFRNGKAMSEMTNLLQKLEKPILVDFNDVLANNSRPIVGNPEALAPFQKLKKIGTPVIITTAKGWAGIKQILEEYAFWSDDVVLITRENYSDDLEWSEFSSEENKKIRRDFEVIAEENGFFDKPRMDGITPGSNYIWSGATADKRVAPFFMKTFLIPLLDDFHGASVGNLGILPITVTPWDYDKLQRGQEPSTHGTAFSDAVDQVEAYYAAMDAESQSTQTPVLH